MSHRIHNHPILDIPPTTQITFYYNDQAYQAHKSETIAAALFANGITIFGHHHKDGFPQGIFCANGQCARCMVIADGLPVKACMTRISEGMRLHSADGLPPIADDKNISQAIPPKIKVFPTDVLIIGGGPAGLSAAIQLSAHNIPAIIVDDKAEMGGKLVLQTHKFFGSVEDSYAGTRGIDIAKKLVTTVSFSQNISLWSDSTVLYVFKDKKVGVLKQGEYVLVEPKIILNAAGAREKFLRFTGNSLPGVYGAGAFQTLVNRDLVKSSNRLFIVGGGNVGLIAGYHALQAGIQVVGLVEAMTTCGGYKVHFDKLRRVGVPVYTSHTILSANGGEQVESITIAQVDKDFKVIPHTEKSFACDTILIAVGLDSIDEFTVEARQCGIPVYSAGDASEIAEASSAMFNGKIVGVSIAKALGADVADIPQSWIDKADILKSHPGSTTSQILPDIAEGVFPVIHCVQEIPCNPCTTTCPTNSIKITDGSIIGLPHYDGHCIGCGKCVLICPGLAISLVDYRQDRDHPTVTLPYEDLGIKIEIGDSLELVDMVGNDIGIYPVKEVIKNSQYKTQLVRFQIPAKIAKKAISFVVQKSSDWLPLPDVVYPDTLDDNAMLCLCERVSVGDVRKLIKSGITDINQIKAITRLSMGACGSKTCGAMIKQLFRAEGVAPENVVANTHRPLFIEVPLEKFNLTGATPADTGRVPSSPAVTNTVHANVGRIPSSSMADIIIIGAGSIGVPTALALAKSHKKVLCLENLPSPGQANNKKAIGGVRATHSDIGKIQVCQRSIEIFSTWKEAYGDDIGWQSHGYSYPAYDDTTQKNLQDLLQIQKKYGLNISWISAQELLELAPGLNPDGLRGGTFSPQDGNCSPLLSCNAFYFQSLKYGASYHFRENVLAITYENGVFTVKTDRGEYQAPYVVNASGNHARAISSLLEVDCQVYPDCHEAGITEPVQPFFRPMIVDVRADTGSQNYYFYQNHEGQIVFCITPDPQIFDVDSDSTSEFLPLCVSRMLALYPRLRNIKVRRLWRGQYPMTPDAFPIIGATREYPHFIQAVGMCGQGFMLGPAVGELVERIISDTLTDSDKIALQSFDPYRDFSGMEKFT